MFESTTERWTGPDGWNDLAAGLCLLYMGPDGPEDLLIRRARRAMNQQDEEAIEHIVAILIVHLKARGKVETWMCQRWEALSAAMRKGIDNDG